MPSICGWEYFATVMQPWTSLTHQSLLKYLTSSNFHAGAKINRLDWNETGAFLVGTHQSPLFNRRVRVLYSHQYSPILMPLQGDYTSYDYFAFFFNFPQVFRCLQLYKHKFSKYVIYIHIYYTTLVKVVVWAHILQVRVKCLTLVSVPILHYWFLIDGRPL